MPRATDRFATAITCIDGRVQRPVVDWVKWNLNVHYVDLITEPGSDKVLSSGPESLIEDVIRRVLFSVRHHFSPVVALTGHHDCAANVASREEHVEQIRAGAGVLLAYNMNVRVLGLWVNEWESVDLVCDTQSPGAKLSFL